MRGGGVLQIWSVSTHRRGMPANATSFQSIATLHVARIRLSNLARLVQRICFSASPKLIETSLMISSRDCTGS